MSSYRKVYGTDGSTRTYVDGVLVDGTEPSAENGGVMLLNDLDKIYGGGFESPIDGTFITSRSHLREHNKRNGVIQTGDVRGEAFKDRVKKRMRYNPEARKANGFSWAEPSVRRSSANLTEI